MNWLQEFLRRQREADLYSEMPIDTYQSYSPYSPVRSLGNTGPRPRMSRPMPAARQFIPGDAGTYGTSSMSASFPSAEGLTDEQRQKAMLMALTGTGLPVGRLAAGSLALKKAGPALVNAATKARLWTPGFVGASRAGEVIVGRDAAGKLVSRIAKYPGQYKWRGRPTRLGYGVAGTAAGAPLLVDQLKENGITLDFGEPKELVDTETGFTDPYEDFSGAPIPTTPKQVAEVAGNAVGDPTNSVVEETSGNEPASNKPLANSNLASTEDLIASNGGQSDPEKFRVLQSMYGKYAQDPKARKQQYLDQLNKIYKNAMILNAVANITGGKSMANAYVSMATGKMDAIEKFDNEERMQSIWKDVFFNENGEFSPPPDWQSTYEAVIKLGGTPKEAEELASSMFKKPSSTDKVPGGVTTEQYMLWKKMTSQAQTPEEKADAEAYGRMVGAIRDDRSKITPNTASNLITKIDMGEIPDNGMRDKLLKIINDALPNSTVEIATPQQTEASVTQQNGETREQYEARVRKRYPNASEEDIQATVNAKYPNG
jgi:hypothetical protein